MREYEFRGRVIDDNIHRGTWKFGDLEYNRAKNKARIHEYTDNGEYYRQYTVDPKTVGLFIGLKDKNCKKIYEGDILQVEFSDGSGSNCIVGWDDETCSYGLMNSYTYQSKLEGYDFAKFSSQILQNFYNGSIIFNVIGNVHDNPELLKKK